MIMPSSGPRLYFLRSLALKMVCLGCLELWQARTKLRCVLTAVLYSGLLGSVLCLGVRYDRILLASGDEL